MDVVRRTLGFTLVEVMVAVAILGLCLVSLFAGEIGAVHVATRARNTSTATLLARCKLGEIEEKIMKDGLPAVSADDTDHCCEDGPTEGFFCDWRVERIVLPDAPDTQGGQGGGALGALAGTAAGHSPATGNGGPPPDPLHGQNLESLMTGGGGGMGGGAGGMSSFAISFTYPVLKPTIEEQVRRVTVHVRWHEGSREHSFDVVQYYVADAASMPGMQDAMGNLGAPPGTPNAGGQQPVTPQMNTGPFP